MNLVKSFGLNAKGFIESVEIYIYRNCTEKKLSKCWTYCIGIEALTMLGYRCPEPMYRLKEIVVINSYLNNVMVINFKFHGLKHAECTICTWEHASQSWHPTSRLSETLSWCVSAQICYKHKQNQETAENFVSLETLKEISTLNSLALFFSPIIPT